MLLFFFMVVTVIKKTPTKSVMQLPEIKYLDYVKKHEHFINLSLILQDDTEVFYINNDFIIGKEKLEAALRKFKLDSENPHELKVKLIVDQNVMMGNVNQLKEILQKLELYKVEYIAIKNDLI